jgi:hypothetical protein
MALTPQDQKTIIDAHNAYRLDPTINVPWIEWSSDLATGAQKWAETEAQTKNFDHSPLTDRPGLGENIALGPQGAFAVQQLVDLWGKGRADPQQPSEKENFQPGVFSTTSPCPVSKTGNWSDVGHYSQVIWRRTVGVGCGLAKDPTTGDDYLVCRYSPAGNWSGEGVPFPASTLPYVCCASSTNIWRVDTAFTVFQYQPSSKTWTKIEASEPMKQVSVGSDGTVWGVTRNNTLTKYANNAWGSLPGGYFVQVSVASANLVWGVNKNDDVWRYTGSQNPDGSWWIQIAPGRLIKQVSVGSDGTVCGVDPKGVISQYANNAWTALPADPGGYFAQVSVGSANLIWGVNAVNDVYQYNGSSTSWTQIAPGSKMTQVSIASDRTICGVDPTGVISQYANNAWTPIGS